MKKKLFLCSLTLMAILVFPNVAKAQGMVTERFSSGPIDVPLYDDYVPGRVTDYSPLRIQLPSRDAGRCNICGEDTPMFEHLRVGVKIVTNNPVHLAMTQATGDGSNGPGEGITLTTGQTMTSGMGTGGGCDGNMTVFDDNAALPIASAVDPNIGMFRPADYEPLVPYGVDGTMIHRGLDSYMWPYMGIVLRLDAYIVATLPNTVAHVECYWVEVTYPPIQHYQSCGVGGFDAVQSLDVSCIAADNLVKSSNFKKSHKIKKYVCLRKKSKGYKSYKCDKGSKSIRVVYH